MVRPISYDRLGSLTALNRVGQTRAGRICCCRSSHRKFIAIRNSSNVDLPNVTSHMYFKCQKSNTKAEENCDGYGDSYTRDTSIDEMKVVSQKTANSH